MDAEDPTSDGARNFAWGMTHDLLVLMHRTAYTA